MNRDSDAFKGGNFCWFTGVVEDINDPEKLGRVRARAFGYHTESLVDIKTDALPWATVMGPTNSANISGIGTTTHGLVNGSWVVGFFRDGPSAQDPIIMGTVGSTYEEKPKTEVGFSDSSGTYPKFQQDTDGKDLESTYVDTNLLARGTNTITRELDTVTEEPATKYAAVYPNNKVQITTGNDNVHITGVCNLTIDSTCNTTIGGDWNINVSGNKNETIGGNVVEDVGGNVNETVGGNVTEDYSGSQKTTASSMDINGGSEIDMDAGTINLN